MIVPLQFNLTEKVKILSNPMFAIGSEVTHHSGEADGQDSRAGSHIQSLRSLIQVIVEELESVCVLRHTEEGSSAPQTGQPRLLQIMRTHRSSLTYHMRCTDCCLVTCMKLQNRPSCQKENTSAESPD